MTIRKILLFSFVMLVAELVALGLVLTLIISGQQELAKTEKLRYRAFKVADELQQSSDDLTKMARTYVSTGDAAFEQYFGEILEIRDGKKTRPRNYGRIYWDFVAAGQKVPGSPKPAISLNAQMKALNLTTEEVKQLRIAKANSDALVAIENRAMNAVKGLFNEDGQIVQRAPDLDLARTLMFGERYHAAKAAIMKMDGLTLLEHLNDYEDHLRTIIISAYGDMDNIRTAMNPAPSISSPSRSTSTTF